MYISTLPGVPESRHLRKRLDYQVAVPGLCWLLARPSFPDDAIAQRSGRKWSTVESLGRRRVAVPGEWSPEDQCGSLRLTRAGGTVE